MAIVIFDYLKFHDQFIKVLFSIRKSSPCRNLLFFVADGLVRLAANTNDKLLFCSQPLSGGLR